MISLLLPVSIRVQTSSSDESRCNCNDAIVFLTRINTPPPCLFLSFLYTGRKISEFKMESSKCDSVPIKMSILCNDIQIFISYATAIYNRTR